MNTLHILNSSPFKGKQFDNCLLFASAGDAILLTGDAVYALQSKSNTCQALLKTQDIALFALAEDISSRAIKNVPNTVKIIDYPRFVKICVKYKRTNSWL